MTAARSTPLRTISYRGSTIHAKLEALQPTGSFKVRGALRFVRDLPDDVRCVWTASAGNTGSALAYAAKTRGLGCTVVVPDHVPASKVARIEAHGGRVVRVPFDECFATVSAGEHPQATGTYLHPVAAPAMQLGGGEIGLEIVDELPQLKRLFVPWGGGGLACGIAAALRDHAPTVDVTAVEVETATPLSAAMGARASIAVQHASSFVDGIGVPRVLAEMLTPALSLISQTVVVSLDQIREAMALANEQLGIRLEGAGAAALAAAMAATPDPSLDATIACVLSGSNIDPDVFERECAAGRRYQVTRF